MSEKKGFWSGFEETYDQFASILAIIVLFGPFVYAVLFGLACALMSVVTGTNLLPVGCLITFVTIPVVWHIIKKLRGK